MPEKPTDEQLLKEVREILNEFEGKLVEHLGPVEQTTTRTRLLRLFEVLKQASLRRIVDLADAAHEMFRQKRLVPACTLTRSVFETVGILYYIHKKLVEHTEKSDPESIHNLLMSAVFGRKDTDWPEKSIQVLTAIDHIDKEFRNYSPPIGVQLARESHLNSNEVIVSVVGHGLEVAGDAAIGLGVLAVSEAAGDFLLDLAHAQVTFGAVVGERHV